MRQPPIDIAKLSAKIFSKEFFSDVWEKITGLGQGFLGSRGLLIFKIIALVVSLWLIACAIFLIAKTGGPAMKAGELIKAFRTPNLPKKIDKKWRKILADLESGEEAVWKLAIIEADNIFDSILKRMALPGKDMGERLSNIKPAQLKGLSQVWEAHKLRNRIVHEEGLRLGKSEAEAAVKKIEEALKELGVL